jgi:3-(methylthio)propionyl---CoA ligase
MGADDFVQIVDRTKDVVKSGGEWINSIELENITQSHLAIKEAAVLAKTYASLLIEDICNHVKGRVSIWCVSDDMVIVDELPHTATGKLIKMTIREMVLKRLARNHGKMTSIRALPC